jgi:hypothetical protein
MGNVSKKIDRVDVRARLVVGQAFMVGERFGLVTDRRVEDSGTLLSVEYVTDGKRLQTVRVSRLESVASVVTAFATRAEYDAQRTAALEWRVRRDQERKQNSYQAQHKTKPTLPAASAEPSACIAPLADLERRVLLIESTLCKYLLSLMKASDGDGSMARYFEEKGGLRVQ